MYDVVFDVSKSLYPALAVLKAAFAFVDTCYVHIGENPNSWVVEISPKPSSGSQPNVRADFENELIAQSVRLHVYQKTHHIREILLARAMSSTLIVGEDTLSEAECDEDDVSQEELDAILADWFESHGR